MATTTDSTPAARWDLPMEQAERGVDNTLRLRLYRSGSVHVPSSVTVTLERDNGSAIVDAATATVGSDGVASYTVASATLADEPLGAGYMLRWTADGRSYDIPLHLVRTTWYPTVSDVDVRRRWPYIDAGNRGSLTQSSTWQGLIDEAALVIQHRLIEAGRRPYLILSPSSLREPHLLLSGALIHEALASRGNPVMERKAEQLRMQYETAMARASFDYDEDENGRVDDDERRLAAESSVWLGGAPGYRRFR